MKTKLFKLCLIAPIGVSIVPSLASCSLVEDFKNRPRQIDGFDWIGRESGLIDPWFYRVDEEKQEVTYWNLTRIKARDLIIPNYVMYKGKKCKVILDPQAFYEAHGNLVGSIELNDWCDKVPSQCFFDDNNLTKVIFHVYPKVIGSQAFYNCRALKEIVVKNSDQTIDTNWVEEIVNIEEQAFWAAAIQGKLSFGPSLESIGSHAFDGNYPLESMDFTRAGEKFTSISPSAFESCTGLINVFFSKYIDTIGDSAFGNCQNLKNVCFEVDEELGYKNITSIGNSAFAKCDMFSGFKPMPGKPGSLDLRIDKIGINCFQYDKAFENNDSQTWIQHLTSLPASTFEGCKIRSWNLTKNLQQIGSSALAFNTNLFQIYLTGFESSGSDVPEGWKKDPTIATHPDIENVFLGCAEKGQIIVDTTQWSPTIKQNWIDWFNKQGIIVDTGHWEIVPPTASYTN